MSLTAAESYVSQCSLGQTETASFVIAIEAPLETDGQILAMVEPFGRQASAFLMRSLALLQSAVATGNTERLLDPPAGQPVVTANLCEAIIEMVAKGSELDLRVRGSWSPILTPPVGVPSVVYFERGTFGVIETLGQQVRPTRGPNPAQFVGLVSQLAGDPGTEGPVEGDIQLIVLHEEELLHVRVTLGADDYRAACAAHVNQRFVKVRGVLHRGARVHRLSEPTEFTVIDE